MAKGPLWTETEKIQARKLAETYSLDEVAKFLGRSRRAVDHMMTTEYRERKRRDKSTITPEQIETIVSLWYDDDYTLDEVCAAVGLSKGRVTVVARKQNLSSRGSRPRGAATILKRPAKPYINGHSARVLAGLYRGRTYGRAA